MRQKEDSREDAFNKLELEYDVDKDDNNDYNNDSCPKCDAIEAQGGERPPRPQYNKTWESYEIHGTLRNEQIRELKQYLIDRDNFYR